MSDFETEGYRLTCAKFPQVLATIDEKLDCVGRMKLVDHLRCALEHPTNGVLGMVDELCAVCGIDLGNAWSYD